MLGALLIVSGTTFCGAAAARRLGRRTRVLASLASAAEMLASEIEFCMNPLPVIMGKLARRYETLAPLFGPCAKSITGESGFEANWSEALAASGLPLNADERTLLLELGGVLGRYDAQGQQNALAQVKRRLSDMLADARAEQAAKSKLFGFMGVAAGLLIVILTV